MKNILIIEDSKTINNIIAKELRKLSFSVSQTFSLAEAKEAISQQKYHLIILDLHLPDGEGSDLIANIQSLTRTKVVVLTSLQDKELREELFEYGILDYIIKDTNLLYSIAEIVKIIHTLNSKKREDILVIDDSKFIVKQIKTILEPRNYHITPAYTAKSALHKIKQRCYELIILDMELPDMHGMELLELLRKENRLLHTPIVVLSGSATPQIIRNVLKNGANDFLKKPFVFEEFILKIDLWIDYFQKEKEIEKKNRELADINKHLQELVEQKVQENRQKDKLMLTQSRQAQMGEMIAMIAHQWRQPLNAISAAASLLEFQLTSGLINPDEAIKTTEKIKKFVLHLSNTIDDFRDFFKPQKKQVPTDFATIVKRAVSLVEHTLHNNAITLKIETKEERSFESYENELVQVVLNLLNNAKDALASKKVKDPQIVVTIEKNRLCIEDNAGGIESDIVEKIFEPYFSTKESKNGTGLGLYMSKIIIEDHCKGKLSVSNTDKGAKFCITLS